MISIITINKNNVSGLRRTIQSVVSQTHPHVDFIVVDGNSSDGSGNLRDEFKSGISTFISEPDSGIYSAMNKGIRCAKGDYLLFLNSGDYLLHNDVLKFMSDKLHTYDVISGDIVIEDKKGVVHRCQSHDEITLDFFFSISLYHQATFISREAFYKYGDYDETFRLGGDYEFFIRLFFRHNASYCHVSEEVSHFRADGISNRADWAEINAMESLRAWELNVSSRTLEVFSKYHAFRHSSVFWIYSKTETSGLYRTIFKFIRSLRTGIYRRFKK